MIVCLLFKRIANDLVYDTQVIHYSLRLFVSVLFANVNASLGCSSVDQVCGAKRLDSVSVQKTSGSCGLSVRLGVFSSGPGLRRSKELDSGSIRRPCLGILCRGWLLYRPIE